MSKMGTCNACRFQVPWGASKCGHCGQSLTWESESGSDILGGIVALLIVAGLISMCSSDKSSNNVSKTPVTDSSNKDPSPKWTVPDETPQSSNKDPSPKWTVPDETPQAQQPQQVHSSQTEPTQQWVVPKED
jgi:hypothetical protein